MAGNGGTHNDKRESLLEILRSQQYSNVLKNVYSSASNVVDPLKNVDSNIVSTDHPNQKFFANTKHINFNSLQSNHLAQSVRFIQLDQQSNQSIHSFFNRQFRKKLLCSNLPIL